MTVTVQQPQLKPWQFDWKRPRWSSVSIQLVEEEEEKNEIGAATGGQQTNTLTTTTTTTITKEEQQQTLVVVDHAAVALRLGELQTNDWLAVSSSLLSSSSSSSENTASGPFVLTVTLLATNTNSNNTNKKKKKDQKKKDKKQQLKSKHPNNNDDDDDDDEWESLLVVPEQEEDDDDDDDDDSIVLADSLRIELFQQRRATVQETNNNNNKNIDNRPESSLLVGDSCGGPEMICLESRLFRWPSYALEHPILEEEEEEESSPDDESDNDGDNSSYCSSSSVARRNTGSSAAASAVATPSAAEKGLVAAVETSTAAERPTTLASDDDNDGADVNRSSSDPLPSASETEESERFKQHQNENLCEQFEHPCQQFEHLCQPGGILSFLFFGRNRQPKANAFTVVSSSKSKSKSNSAAAAESPAPKQRAQPEETTPLLNNTTTTPKEKSKTPLKEQKKKKAKKAAKAKPEKTAPPRASRGLVATSFCRSPPATGQADAQGHVYEDALDVLNLMSLTATPGEGVAAGAAQEATEAAGIASTTTATGDQQQLLLVCLNNYGKVFWYNPLDLLFHRHNRRAGGENEGGGEGASRVEEEGGLSSASTIRSKPNTNNNQEEPPQEFVDGLARLMLGDQVFDNVHENFLPLSKPFKLLKLTNMDWQRQKTGRQRQLERRQRRKLRQQQKQKQRTTNNNKSGGVSVNSRDYISSDSDGELDDDDYSFFSNIGGGGGAAGGKNQKKVSIWDPSLWNTNIDPATLCHETKENCPIQCVVAWEYLAIIGKGHRIRQKQPKANAARSASRGGTTRRSAQSVTSSSSVAAAQQGEDIAAWWETEAPPAPAAAKTNAQAKATWEEPPKVEISVSAVPRSIAGDASTTASMKGWRSRGEQKKKFDGGFCTFVSLRNYSEVRTVYLPFVPREASPLLWGDLILLVVLGYAADEAIAIRIDSSDLVLAGEDGMAPMSASQAMSLSSGVVAPGKQHQQYQLVNGNLMVDPDSHKTRELSIRRFQIIPIILPIDAAHNNLSTSTLAVVASRWLASPPGLTFVHDHQDSGITGTQQLTVTQRTFSSIDMVNMLHPQQIYLQQQQQKLVSPDVFASYYGGAGEANTQDQQQQMIPAIITKQETAHVARFSLPLEDGVALGPGLGNEYYDKDNIGRVWCSLEQGCCLVGVNHRRYFICWEGATEVKGAFVYEMGATNITQDETPISGGREGYGDRHLVRHILQPDICCKPKKEAESSLPPAPLDSKAPGEVMSDAMESISNEAFFRDNVVVPHAPVSFAPNASFTNIQKSDRLLRQCSSWTYLHQTNESLGLQVPVVSIVPRLCIADAQKSSSSSPSNSPLVNSHGFLSMRKTVVDNGATTPFQQILSWMSERDDFFAAASLGLSLLRDAESKEALRHLWKTFDKINDESERAKLEGLLDGITKISNQGEEERTHLADMTVGCLTKGGFAMSSTLENFLDSDKNYDVSRTSLMLVAAAARAVSDDDESVLSVMGKGYVKDEDHEDNILWPVRCLMRAAVARNVLEMVLQLVNKTIPDEIRHRLRGGLQVASMPSMGLCKSLVTLIISAAPEAAECLLNLTDEQSKKPYWGSLDHETQLELSLIEVNQKMQLLRQMEVRSWVLEQLHKEVAGNKELPTTWLQRLCLGCFRNAGCNLCAILEGSDDDSDAENEPQDDPDDLGELKKYAFQIHQQRKALLPSRGSGGLDFDLAVSALLLLEQRNVVWNERSKCETQALLNTVCYWAGRRTTEELTFPMNAPSLMKHCTMAGNVQAGANLIGGQNGFILDCAHLLIEQAGMSMEDAELFLVRDPFASELARNRGPSKFTIEHHHRHILWLMGEHVLTIRTFGDFEPNQARGRVDPVLAAKICLRTWWCLNRNVLADSRPWLVGWLQRQLEMKGKSDETSPHRLVCAALTRALVWPSGVGESNEGVLASRLELPGTFLLSLARSCCGLVEALTPDRMAEVWQKKESEKNESGRLRESVPGISKYK